MQTRKAERLISQHVNFAQSLKFAKGGEVSKIIRLKVGEAEKKTIAEDTETVGQEPTLKVRSRVFQRTQRFKATYRLARTPWGEGPQQVRLELAEPRAV